MRDHDLYFMFNLINLSTEITKESILNHISKYGKKKQILKWTSKDFARPPERTITLSLGLHKLKPRIKIKF